jgi:hypothetical protein
MRVLQRAVEILGSERALARKLRVPRLALSGWLTGAERPISAVFLAAVDVLIERADATGLSQLHSLAAEHSDGLDFRFDGANSSKS